MSVNFWSYRDPGAAGEYHSGSAQKALDKLLELVTSQHDY